MSKQGTWEDDCRRCADLDSANAIDCWAARCVEAHAEFEAYMRQGPGHSAVHPGKEAGCGTNCLTPSKPSLGALNDVREPAGGPLQTDQIKASLASMTANTSSSFELTPSTQAVMQTEPEQSGASDKSSWTPTFRDYTPSDLQENDQEPQEEGEENDEDDTSSWQEPAVKAEQCDLDKEAALLLSLSDIISGGQNASQEGSRRAHQLPNHMPVFLEGNLEYLFEPFKTAEEAARVYDREMLILKGAKARLNYADSYHGVAIDLLGIYEEKAGKGAGAAETGRRKARGKANAPETGMPAERACRKRKGSDREDAVICAMMSMPVEQQGAARAERAAKRSARTRTLASADIPMPDPVPLAPCAMETGAGLMTSGALGMPVIPASTIASSPDVSPAACLPSAGSRSHKKSAPKRSPSRATALPFQ
ncbi:hypothetical protein COCSUDRAFT_61420 [Coccomyxa subellipsoidea C-169]|uniref:AP2/ERF domain-containing protein n=1 Tax=Coccomyxa subellipsoidea (strain C-169) TaxID=574566 RepID=I0Z3G0_COCSC|nr:hypothetical protein COCSUDRAFT_61420 [Coccomyxa subellipsoidea C-169]EIE25179.1 hypothetical protein COCSUDRAFT_61420 [Coccomyxa subellipsoidea C-169]|eukprot:XP_005649723.1 hypothetical protein COCSUDRAFT_61420 [Coccomyxa subellipsoidea C-169]